MSRSFSDLSYVLLGVPLAMVSFGTVIFVLRWARLMRSKDNADEQVVLGAVSQSLRERGELAASLGQLRTAHERLLDALPMGILWVDQGGRLAALNAEGQRLLGVRAGVLGMTAAFVLEPFPWLLDALAQTPGSVQTCDGGGRRWRMHRVEAPDRVGSMLQFEDITEAEQAERRALLRERFAELGEMTAGVAHQLKNGLAVLKGHGQLLRRAGQEAVATEILEETEGLERLVQRFLQWARPLEPVIGEVDLRQVAESVVMELQRRPAFQGRRLEVTGVGQAQADGQLLHEALLNLAENACEATPSGGLVRIRVGTGALEVLDEGPGLGEDTLIRMMRPFESGRPDGTGLGLPLALKWLNAQGADLHLEKRPEGGTVARIRWV